MSTEEKEEMDTPDFQFESDEDFDQQQALEENILQEEIALGGTPAGKATNEALRSLARTGRSFLIYDPRNEAIRGFLQDLQKCIFDALETYGEMDLEIRPFEMLRGAEVVYLERDRERSLAFRLFRDGVRRLVISQEVTWEEILRLLEILSIRFTGVRQQEDDIVTLLLKSGFKNIEISAVEGFVPDDEEYCNDDLSAGRARQLKARRRSESHVEVPRDWDLPLPKAMNPIELSFVSVPDDVLNAIQEEGSSKNLPTDTVRLLLEMLKVVNDPTDPTNSSDIDGLVQEVRDFLLAESQLDAVLQLVHQVHDIVVDPEEREELVGSFTNERALRRIIASLPKAVTEPPPELIEMLELSPINHLPVLIDILNVERRMSSRSVLRILVGHYIQDQAQMVIQSLYKFESSVKLDLMDALYEKDKQLGIDIVLALKDSTESSVVHKCLTYLEECPVPSTLKEYLLNLLDNTEIEGVRARVLILLKQVSEKDMFDIMEGMLEKNNRLTMEESTLIGEVMVGSYAGKARSIMMNWIQVHKWYSLNRLTVKRSQQIAAIAGLSLLPGEKVVAQIEAFKQEADLELADFCVRRMVVRRQKGIE